MSARYPLKAFVISRLGILNTPCNSLFPIGSFVELSDQRVARVIAAGQKHFTKPTVRIFDTDKREWGDTVDLSETEELKVSRAVEKGQPPG